MQTDTSIYLSGYNAISEALRSNAPIEKIFLRFGSTLPQSIVRHAHERQIPISTLSHEKFDRLARQIGASKHHQNIIALRQMYHAVAWESVRTLAQTKATALLVACDQITDPHNLGAIARTAAAAGADALITPLHNTAPITPAALAAASGAFEHIRFVRVRSLLTTLANAKEYGWWIIGSDASGSHRYTDHLYDRPVIVVVGSEGSGIRRSVLRICDAVIQIPMAPTVESLNASVATGVVLFEIRRQQTMERESRAALEQQSAPAESAQSNG